MLLLSPKNFLKINFFKEFFQEHYQSVKQFGSRSGSNVGPDLGPNCLQAYQQTTKVAAYKERVKQFTNDVFKFSSVNTNFPTLISCREQIISMKECGGTKLLIPQSVLKSQ